MQKNRDKGGVPVSTTLVCICKFANHTMLQNLDKVLDRLDASKDRLRARGRFHSILEFEAGHLSQIYNVDH